MMSLFYTSFGFRRSYFDSEKFVTQAGELDWKPFTNAILCFAQKSEALSFYVFFMLVEGGSSLLIFL